MRNSLLAIALAVGFAVTLNACNTTADVPKPDPLIEENNAVGQEHETYVKVVDPFVKVGSDKKFVLEARAKSSLSPEYLARATDDLKAINEQVSAGALIVNSDNSLSLADGGLSLQANFNGWRLYWWGLFIAMDNNRTRSLINRMNQGAGVSGIISFIPFIGGAGSAFGLAQSVLTLGAGNLTACNTPGKGIYLYLRWFGRAWCRSQR
jgi:predicted small secreted protein